MYSLDDLLDVLEPRFLGFDQLAFNIGKLFVSFESLSSAIDLFEWELEFRELVLISYFLLLACVFLDGFSCFVKISRGFYLRHHIQSASFLIFSFAVFSFIFAKVSP